MDQFPNFGSKTVHVKYCWCCITPMFVIFDTGIKHDVFYTMVTIKLVMSLLLHNYDVITCILAST